MKQAATGSRAIAAAAARAARATRLWAGLAGALRAFVQSSPDTYHPELHYMRGPGPKWRAKHGRAVR